MQRFRLDAMAIGLSSLCMIHCVASLAGALCHRPVIRFWPCRGSLSSGYARHHRAGQPACYRHGVPPTSLDLAVDAMWLEGTLTVSSQDTEYGTAGYVLEGKSAEPFTGYPR